MVLEKKAFGGKSKTISVKVSYEEYAKFLIECSAQNCNISSLARKKITTDVTAPQVETVVQPVQSNAQANIKKENSTIKGLNTKLKKELAEYKRKLTLTTKNKAKEVLLLNKKINALDGKNNLLIKDLSNLTSENKKLKKGQGSTEKELASSINHSNKLKLEKNREINKLSRKIKELESFVLEEKEKAKKLEKRLLSANSYLEEKQAGKNVFGAGELIQF